jgi:hypothetical protein
LMMMHSQSGDSGRARNGFVPPGGVPVAIETLSDPGTGPWRRLPRRPLGQ